MKEYLYSVTVKSKKTGERTSLQIWAKNVDDATHSLCGSLIGYNCLYEWCGSSPVYENNKLVEREIIK
jgi:hypothetical protein